jgi:predicted small lipoprotein YifL
MKTTIGKHLAVLSMLGFLTACAQVGPLEAENATARRATETARTYSDHDRLAQRYQNTAKELRVKAEEQKKLLQHYEEKSYLYGRQAQDNKSHTAALLSRYERAVEDNVKLAAHHRNMAAELAKGNYAASDAPRQDDTREIKAKVSSDPGNRL